MTIYTVGKDRLGRWSVLRNLVVYEIHSYKAECERRVKMLSATEGQVLPAPPRPCQVGPCANQVEGKTE